MRLLGRLLLTIVSLPLLALGLAALLGGEAAADWIRGLAPAADADGGIPFGLAADAVGVLDGPIPQACAIAFGGILLALACWPRRSRDEGDAIRAHDESSGKAARKEHGPSKREIKRLRRRAKAIGAESGAEAAGDFLLDHGLRDEAAALFIAHSVFQRAAEVRHDQNRFDEAAELFEKAGGFEAAGSTWAQLERFDDAARAYLAAGKYSVAGEMLERAGRPREAGDAYREIGFHRHAAQAYLQASAEAEAAECLVAAFDEEGGAGTGVAEDKRKELSAMGRRAGELLTKLERFEEAEQIFMRSGALGLAAKVAFHTGAFERAADLFTRVGRGDLAARCFESLGDAVRAARAQGQFLRERGEDERAVELLEQAGEHQEAGDLYRKLERYDRAGECYANGADHAAAAEMFRVAGLPDRAAEAFAHDQAFAEAAACYAQADQPLRQAAMLEQTGDLFEAGRIFAEQEQPDEAIRLLQRLETTDPKFSESCSILGRIFAAKGMHGLSIKKFEEAIGDGGLRRENVAAYYELGVACEQRAEFGRAAEIFERILSFDYHYEDVSTRLEQARTRDAAASSGPATLGGPATFGGPASGPALRRYEVLEEIGRGGMGVVYRARDSVLEREVAYKVLPEQLRESPAALKNFLREAKAAAQLNHTNIVTVYDAGESEHGFYLAMELVEGTTLKAIVQRRGPLPAGGALFILRQMADALHYAHSRKVVHRDIKSANTMWTRDKQVKIMDFGLAKLMQEVRNATTVVSGTPFYMSPEQTLGRSVDHRTDIYSLGVATYELITGQLPFRRGNVPYHHVHTPAPDPRSVQPDVPEALARVILRCMAKAPDERYQTAGEILADLDRLGSAAAG